MAQNKKNKQNKETRKHNPGVASEAAKSVVRGAGSEVGKQAAKAVIKAIGKAITSNHPQWWELPAKLNSGINFARPTHLLQGGSLSADNLEPTNVVTYFTYPMDISFDVERSSDLANIANQLIKQIRLDLRSNLTYGTREVANYLELVNALTIEVNALIMRMRALMTSQTKVTKFTEILSSIFSTTLNDTYGTQSMKSYFTDDVTLNDALSKLTILISKLNKLEVPINLYERNKWMFSNIFTDETNNAKTQYYYNIPVADIEFNSSDSTCLNRLETANANLSMNVNTTFNNINNLIAALGLDDGVGYVISADLKKSSVKTVSIGEDIWPTFNQLTPIQPVYDATYLRALDNMNGISYIGAYKALQDSLSDVVKEKAFGSVFIDIDTNSPTPADVVSAMQLTIPGTHSVTVYNSNTWENATGWLVPITSIAIQGCTTPDFVYCAPTSVGYTLVGAEGLTADQTTALAMVTNVDHCSYPLIIRTNSNASTLTMFSPCKEVSLRAKVPNRILLEIKYLANLGLIIGQD